MNCYTLPSFLASCENFGKFIIYYNYLESTCNAIKCNKRRFFSRWKNVTLYNPKCNNARFINSLLSSSRIITLGGINK